VAVADLDAKAAGATVDLVGSAGGSGMAIGADVTDGFAVEAMVRATAERFGRLDCAVNNAGVLGRTLVPVEDYPEADWDRVLNANLKGAWLCMKHEIPALRASGRGSIVNMASVAGLVGTRAGAAYIASKHGVIGLTKAAALECAVHGTRVNAVCPAVIDTPMGADLLGTHPERIARITGLHPLGRLGTPEDVAEAVVWLCSDAAAFVTGHALTVDGGYTAQ
jgi:NAD(P)-dependent dehydrogenase (short-subunit alcohol dehydrogenase family)